MQIALTLVFEAARAQATGTPPDRETLNNLRKGLVRAKMLMESQVFVADQMLAHSQLWTPDYLPAIANDDAFDAEAIEAAYTKFLTYLEGVNDVRSTDGAGS